MHVAFRNFVGCGVMHSHLIKSVEEFSIQVVQINTIIYSIVGIIIIVDKRSGQTLMNIPVTINKIITTKKV